jgi:MOSC domain-containing protein YiiM
VTGRLTAVCVVHELRPEPTNPDGLTAIDKRAVAGAVEAGPLGLVGDEVRDTRHHGGEEQAVYAYADEDAAWWAADLGRDVAPGEFGENLRTSGIDVTDAVIGERWRVGGSDGTLLQVTSPRIPCATFARRMGEPHWVKRFTDHGACGAYLSVVEPGRLVAGDRIVVESRPGHGVTVGDTFLRAEPEVMRRLLDADGQDGFALTPKLREYAVRIAARATSAAAPAPPPPTLP